jgi:hypothetical protein
MGIIRIMYGYASQLSVIVCDHSYFFYFSILRENDLKNILKQDCQLLCAYCKFLVDVKFCVDCRVTCYLHCHLFSENYTLERLKEPIFFLHNSNGTGPPQKI